jgi:hypothetical protein
MSEDDGSERWRERWRTHERTHPHRFAKNGNGERHIYQQPRKPSLRERIRQRFEEERIARRQRGERAREERTEEHRISEESRRKGRLEGIRQTARERGFRETHPQRVKAPQRTRARAAPRRSYVTPRTRQVVERDEAFTSPFDAWPLEANPFFGSAPQGRRGRGQDGFPNPFI